MGRRGWILYFNPSAWKKIYFFMPPRLIHRSIFINTVLGSPYRKFDGDILTTFFFTVSLQGFLVSVSFFPLLFFSFFFGHYFSFSLAIKWKIRGIFATLQILFAIFLDLNIAENFCRRLDCVCRRKVWRWFYLRRAHIIF